MAGKYISQVALLGFSFDGVRNKNIFWLLEGTNGKGCSEGYSTSSKQHEQYKAVDDGARRGVPLPDFKFVNDIQDSEEAKLEVKKKTSLHSAKETILCFYYCTVFYTLFIPQKWKKLEKLIQQLPQYNLLIM